MDMHDTFGADYFVEDKSSKMKFEKIKFVKSCKDLRDFSDYITTTIINNDGTGTEVETHIGRKDKKSFKDILDKKSFFVEETKLQDFILNVLHVVANASSWEGIWIDDCAGTLTVVFDDKCMEISVDRAVTDGNNTINSLFYNLMENATFLARHFERAEANVYASYYDPIVNVVCNDDGELYRHGERGVCLYYFLEDKTNFYPNTKQLKFSEFINTLVEKKYAYFGYAFSNLSYWVWHTDAYSSFTKDNLDNFLSNTTKSRKKQYDFLFNKKQ